VSKYRVLIVQDAERDLADIVNYIAETDSAASTNHVLDRILEICDRLEQFPERGHFPPELRAIGMKRYRQVQFKPYRIIYEIRQRDVVVHIILDGRRSFQGLLERRLLR